jgi:hypothetical protein
MKARTKIAVVLAVAAALAAAGAKASWKWHGKVGKAYATHQVAGWSWGSRR